jgi:hypothetical protein
MHADSGACVLLCLEKPFLRGAAFSALLSGAWHPAVRVSWTGSNVGALMDACIFDNTLAGDRAVTVCCAAASVLQRVICRIQIVCLHL